MIIYEEENAVSFDVVYISGLSDAADPQGEGALSTFPSFVIEEGPERKGWMTWSGNS